MEDGVGDQKSLSLIFRGATVLILFLVEDGVGVADYRACRETGFES